MKYPSLALLFLNSKKLKSMNQPRLAYMLFYACTVLFLSSCGGGDEQKSSTDTTSTDSTAANAVTPTNTIITTPQNMMVIKHKAANFAKWKNSYDDHDSFR